MNFALVAQRSPKSHIGIKRDPHVYTMEFEGPLRFRTVTDGRAVDRKAGAKEISQRDHELLGAGLDCDVVSGPGASRRRHASDAKCTRIDERVRFDIDLEAFGRGGHVDRGFASPYGRATSEL